MQKSNNNAMLYSLQWKYFQELDWGEDVEK